MMKKNQHLTRLYKYITALIFVTVHSPLLLSAQKHNSIYFEALGNSTFYSVNYDRIFKLNSRLRLVPRAGIMYLPLTSIKNNRDYGNISIPLELNLLWTKSNNGKNFAEAGIGLSLIGLIQGYRLDLNGDKIDLSYKFAKVTTLRVGFRHQKPEGGLMYRAGLLIPITQDEFSEKKMGDDIFYRLWPGLSIGYTF